MFRVQGKVDRCVVHVNIIDILDYILNYLALIFDLLYIFMYMMPIDSMLVLSKLNIVLFNVLCHRMQLGRKKYVKFRNACIRRLSFKPNRFHVAILIGNMP